MAAEAEIMKKRRLPPWMSSSSSSSSSTTTTTTDKKITQKKESKPKAGTRKRIKKLSRPQLDDDDDEIEEEQDAFSLPAKKKRTSKPVVGTTVEISHPKPKTPCRKTDDPITPTTSLATQHMDNDDGLTVEDLINIAQEYVKANDEQQEVTTTAGESGKQITSAKSDLAGRSISMKVLPAAAEEDISSMGGGLFCNSEQDDKLRKEQSLNDEEIIHTSSRTGDSTQDMLDVFLGPLLRKPPFEEKKWEHVFTEENALDNGLEKHSQKEEESGKEVATLVTQKKKSSLRDMVAMFLD